MQNMVLETLLMNLKLSSLSSILPTLSTFKLTIFKLLYHVIVIDTFSFQLFSQGYPLHFEFLCLPRLCLDLFLVHVVRLLLIVHPLFLFSLILFLVNFLVTMRVTITSTKVIQMSKITYITPFCMSHALHSKHIIQH